MRILYYCLLSLLLLEPLDIGRCEEKKIAISFSRTNAVWIEYLVPLEKFLAERNAWNPGTENFPANIDDCLLKARKIVLETYQGFEHADLSFIDIKQVTKPLPNDGNETKRPVHLVRRVAMSFHFLVRGKAEVKLAEPVIMLLDGTVAEARITNKLDF